MQQEIKQHKKNRVKLLELKARHHVNWKQVSLILNRRHETVRQWASETGGDIPDHSIKLLEILLNNRAA